MNILEAMTILATFEDGFTDFNAFLVASDKSKGQRYVKLFTFLVNSHGRYNNTEASKRLAFMAAYGNSASYNAAKILALIKQLCYWIDLFVLSKKVAEGGLEQKFRADIYRENGKLEQMEEAMEMGLEQALEAVEAVRHYVRSIIFHDQYFYGIGDKRKAEFQLILQRARAELNAFYFGRMFKLLIEILTLHRLEGKEIPQTLRQNLQHLFALLPESPSPLVALELLAIRFYLTPCLQTYLEFKTAFVSNMDKLASEKKFLLTCLLNALAIYPSIVKNSLEEHLFLYQFGMEKHIFIEDGRLTLIRFNNVVLVFKSLGRYDLLKEFIASHGRLIRDKAERKNSVLLANCHLLFGEGKYFTAIKDLDRLKPLDYTFTLNRHILKVKCIFERAGKKYDAYVKIADLKTNFNQLVHKYYRKNYFDLNGKNRYNNFFKLVLAISNTKDAKNTKARIKELYESCEGQLVEMKWIQEKIAARPIWVSIEEIKHIYDTTWNKYDALEKIQIISASLKRKLLRYKKVGYIHENIQKCCLNFLNFICRISDERNPKNSRRHLIRLLESFGECVVEKEWLEEKVKKIRP